MVRIPGFILRSALALGTLAGLAGCPWPSVQAPQVEVFPAAFSFTDGLTQDLFTVSNGGGGTLNWTISTDDPWISFSSVAGSAMSTTPSEVMITVDPSGFANQQVNGSFLVITNAGTVEVPVSLTVGSLTTDPALEVNPTGLSYGNVDVSRSFVVRNTGGGSFDYAIASDQPWVTAINPAAGTITNQQQTVTATIDRTGLAPGTHTAELTVDAGPAGTATVTLTVLVGANPPVLTVSPLALDFGSIQTNLTFNVQNTGGGTLNWTATEAEPWLTLTPANGATSSGGTTTVTATVNRAGLAADTFTADITVSDGTATATVEVTMTVGDTQLIVTPTTLNFGTGFTTRIVSITNGGVGTVNWTIPAPAEPWLTISPLAGSAATGEVDVVLVEIDRSLLPAGTISTTFNVNSNAGNIPVTVNAVVLIPVIEVESGVLDTQTGLPLTNNNGQPIVELGALSPNATFTIRNAGNGNLNWNIDADLFPEWFTITPISGSLAEGAEQVATVTVNRERPAGPYSQAVTIQSNAGNRLIEISMQVVGKIIIGVEPTTLNLGLFDNVTSFSVANYGDPDTILSFQVTSDRDWLFHNPSTGFSIGLPTPVPFKDYKVIDVSIDRSELDGTGGTGSFFIFAVDENNEPLPFDLVEPKTVTVAVQAAPLTFEQANAQTRTPSITRFTFGMRDIAYQSFDLDAATVPMNAFNIFEDDVPLEISETNQFFANATAIGGHGKARTNVMLLLDFSGSMLASVSQLGLGGANPLQTAYIQLLTPFLNALPPDVNVALMEFHDRGTPARLLSPFTQDRAATLAALAGNLGITDFGSTNLFVAAAEAAQRLSGADGVFSQNQNAEINALVMLTDGRVTTPPGELSDLQDILEALRVRAFTLALGGEINNQVLASMAAVSGGHHYSAPPVNAQANLVRAGDNALDLADDLSRQFVLSYLTLNEENNIVTRVNASIDNPSDTSGPLPGTFEQLLNFADVAGDTRLGQVSMEASPQTNGDIVVRLRADYIPRNINKFSFTLVTDNSCDATNPGGVAFTASVVPASEGGLLEGWTPDAGNPVGATSNGTFAFSTSAATPLTYGDFGDLLELRFPAGTPTPFRICLDVSNAIYLVDAEPKYFTFPDSLLVLDQSVMGPSFPTPFVDANPATTDADLTLNFGGATTNLPLTIANIGGSYDYAIATDVELIWELGGLPAFLNSDLAGGEIMSTLTPDTVNIALDRTIEEGPLFTTFTVEWGAGAINQGGSITVNVLATIQAPVMAPANATVNLGAGLDNGVFTISNTGQSTMEWTIDDSTLPAWAELSNLSGDTTTETDIVQVTIDRTAAPVGAQSFMLTVNSDGGTQTVTVNATIVAPTLTVSTNLIDMGTVTSSTSFQISNTGQSTLTWDIDRAAPTAGLSFSVTSGATQDDPDTVGVTLDRGVAGAAGTETIEVQSNGGNQFITIEWGP